jgi:hypothetical protein
MNDSLAIVNFYTANVITPVKLVTPASDFDSFNAAVALKLDAKIGRALVPEPSSLLLIGGGRGSARFAAP